MSDLLLGALALMLVLEGLLPFFSPSSWREMFQRLLQMSDGQIRFFGLVSIVSGALFLCVGVVYDRLHTREIAAYGGLVNRMPLYAFVFLVFTMANVGLPGTSGFVGEFMTLLGTFKVNVQVATLATLGVILSACYALWPVCVKTSRSSARWACRRCWAAPRIPCSARSGSRPWASPG